MQANLTPDEQSVCRLLNVSEQAFMAARHAEIAPPAAALTETELEVCRHIGITPEAFAAEKARGR